MRGPRDGLTALVALSFLAVASAEQDKGQPDLAIAVDLTDGSHVVGTTDIKSVGIRTSYAKMNVPLNTILTIRMREDKETAALAMQNGDNVKGFLDLATLGMKTCFGPVSIRAEHIKGITVLGDRKAMPESLKRSLVVHMPFNRDEGAKAGNLSRPHNFGEVRGARWIQEGKFGGAYEFNGASDLIELGACDSLGITNAMSACAWIRRADRAMVVLSNYRGGDAYSGQFFFGIDGVGVLDVAFGQAPGQCIRYRSADADIVPAGEWHHIAFTYDETRGEGKKIRIYVDGKDIGRYFIQREGTGGPVLQISDRLRIMANRDEGPGGFFKGTVDELMIFNRALSDGEVGQVLHCRE